MDIQKYIDQVAEEFKGKQTRQANQQTSSAVKESLKLVLAITNNELSQTIIKMSYAGVNIEVESSANMM